ncbi:hypothetical protein D6D65_08955 [Moraxella catarrhalis]|nr:hypothetical protein D6D65_08955 [Moraxella catarrhalis]
MANLVLVIDGLKIGTLSSPTYIPSFINSLESLLVEEIYFCEKMDRDLFREIIREGKLENENIFTLEETFDYFMKRCIRDRGNFYFYFKLYEEHFFSYENITVNTPMIKIVSINKFVEFLNELKSYFQ